MWICFGLSLLTPINNYRYADGLEELCGSFILLAITILTDKIIAYLLLALSIGKLIDGQMDPYEYSVNELLWDFISFAGAIALYFYRRKRKK